MPVTKTAKRALRSSKRKEAVNKVLSSRLEIAIRNAKKSPTAQNIKKAISLVDRSVKKNLFHKNKAARIKSTLTGLKKPESKKTSRKKTTKKNK